MMLESGSPIIPFFYHVEPSDLDRQRGRDGVYARALISLGNKRTSDGQPQYDPKTIEKQRNALSDVAERVSASEWRHALHL